MALESSSEIILNEVVKKIYGKIIQKTVRLILLGRWKNKTTRNQTDSSRKKVQILWIIRVYAAENLWIFFSQFPNRIFVYPDHFTVNSISMGNKISTALLILMRNFMFSLFFSFCADRRLRAHSGIQTQ